MTESELDSVPFKGNPTVPIVEFIRGKLKTGDRNQARAVEGFVGACYWKDAGVGRAEYHDQRALKAGQKLGFSPSDLEALSAQATELFTLFKIGLGVNDRGLNISDIVRYQARLNAIRQTKRSLRRRFTALLDYSDDQLRVRNSQARADLSEDPVYGGITIPQVRAAIRARALTGPDYQAALKKSEPDQPEKVVKFSIKSRDEIDWGELEDKIKRSAGPYRGNVIIHFQQTILALLQGEVFLVEDLIRAGLDPDETRQKATAVYSAYCMDKYEERRHQRWLVRQKINQQLGPA